MAATPEAFHWQAASRLIDEYPLAWVISRAFSASPLPLLAERNDNGKVVSLLGYCSRRNPLVKDFASDPAGLILFNGPDGFVSNDLVSERNWGATWNYASARFEVEVELVEEETEPAINRLLEHMQGLGEDRWTTAELAERYHGMLRAIVAFRAHIRRFVPAFKLGQGEQADAFEEIVNGHPNRDLAQSMRAFHEAGG